MENFLFGCGTARGGTGILVQTLAAHSKIEYALDPALALYRSLRNAIVEKDTSIGIHDDFKKNNPLSDYYFSPTQKTILDAILDADLEYSLSDQEMTSIISSMETRGRLDSADLVPYFKELSGKTIKNVFFSLLNLIAHVRGNDNTKCVGIHENWTVEMLPAIARSIPNAYFIIVLRDPRAVMASHFNLPIHLQSSFLSYARGLRKLHELAHYFLGWSLFKNRLCVVTYEELLRKPDQTAKSLCDFLGLSHETGMTDKENHIDPVTGKLRDGISSFEKMVVGYNPDRIDRWREHLVTPRLDAVEMLLDPTFRRFGYFPHEDRVVRNDAEHLISTLVEEQNKTFKWRTDIKPLESELGCEMLRHALLQKKCPIIPDMVERSFLRTENHEYSRSPDAIEKTELAKGGIWFAQ